MKTAISLLYIFVAAILVALIVTELNVSADVQLLALASVTPLVALSVVFIYFCRKGKAWSFAGACILGAVGAVLRVAVSTQPSLEVGGGLPAGVTALYIVLAALVSLKSYESFLELRSNCHV